MAATANKRTPHRAGLLSACVALAFAPGAHALDWKIEPSIETYATYTDNARQSAVNPDDALILGVMPGFVLRSEGSRRVEATLQYGMRGVFRFGDDRDDVMQHNLNALGKAELIEDFLFVDGSARVSQELISLIGSPAGADVNDSNRADVASYSISPYIKKRLGTFAQTELRYTASGTSY
ncbi:MAG: TIGR03016 family PEP-CTERM system-associated outer membrane protein, partial [Gammaproteobacteria bacterium]